MEKRYIAFLVLSVALVLANAWFMRWMNPPRPPAPAAQGQKEAADKGDKKQADAKAAVKKNGEAKIAAAPQPGALPKGDGDKKAAEAGGKEQNQKPAEAPPVIVPPRQWGTLGSVDPDPTNPYRLLVTWDSQGGCIQRIEASSPRLTDQENRAGYLGHLNAENAPKGGCFVRVVGEGTPANLAGLRGGDNDHADRIIELAGSNIRTTDDFASALAATRPGQEVQIVVERGGKSITLHATLTREPMQIVRPEGDDPLSFLMTLESIGKPTIEASAKGAADVLGVRTIAKGADELPGVKMRSSPWRVVQDPKKPNEVSFEYDLWRDLPGERLVVRKIFRLVQVDPADADDPTAAAYHLQLQIQFENQGAEARQLAYRLDGPTGLPIEGAWFANKISPNGFLIPSPVGLRDVAVSFIGPSGPYHQLVGSFSIIDEKVGKPWQDQPLVYIGVDAQYFACVLVPQRPDPTEVNFAQVMPLRVGPVPDVKRLRNRTNFSCRLISEPITLAASGGKFDGEFQVFAGPKKPRLLELYGLQNLVYYGWFGWVSRPMLAILHFFYTIVPNYGVAIVMLTVLVRSCMFPLSRKQALGAQKMQELQPEMKRITERYKGNLEARSKAQQELFAKHNYHPLSGCLPAFIQLPIFMGLYRSLAVDVELRGAPLFGDSVRWCSNLAAPDMLWKWQDYLPDVIAGETGWLGPYFNLLPCITIALFIWQQKKFMPPPTDEQAAMQQKIMRVMTVVMGVMFFKVASGLCLYFIASSTWSMAERKLLPKVVRPAAGQEPPPPPPRKKALPLKPSPSGNGASGSTKPKHRGRK